jgi:hypothetical protein
VGEREREFFAHGSDKNFSFFCVLLFARVFSSADVAITIKSWLKTEAR